MSYGIQKTFIIYSPDDNIVVGSKISLCCWKTNTDSSFNWIKATSNGLSITKSIANPAEPNWNNEHVFILYGSDQFGNGISKGKKINFSNNIGLYSPIFKKFITISKPVTSSIVKTQWRTCNASLDISSPNIKLDQDGYISQNSPVRIKQNGYFFACDGTNFVTTENPLHDDYNKYANYPFMVLSLKDIVEADKANGGPLDTYFTIGDWQKGRYRTIILKLANQGIFVPLGDVIYTIPNPRDKFPPFITRNLYCIFVQQKVEQFDIDSRLTPRPLNFEFARVTTEGPATIINQNCPDGDNDRKAGGWINSSMSNTVGDYIGIGTYFKNASRNSTFWGLHKDYCVSVQGTEADLLLRNDLSLKNTPFYQGGRQLATSADTGSTCDYEMWSTSLLFDRTGLESSRSVSQTENPVEKGFKVYLNTSYGYDGRFMWNLDRGSNWQQNISNAFSNTPLYILMIEDIEGLCCRNSALGFECGVGSRKIDKSNPVCLEYAKQICKGDNQNQFPSKFCQRDYCTTDPNNTLNRIDCDNEYKIFCNKFITDPTGKLSFYNYNLYPDLCACFMTDSKFLNPICDTYASMLGITRNKKAKQSLGIDTLDPTSCKDSCMINPLCKLGAQVPASRSVTRANNSVVIGKSFPDKCKNTELCIQDVTVNNSGVIGEVKVNQNANCQTALQSICIEQGRNNQGQIVGNVKYSPCTTSKTSSDGKLLSFTKKIIEDTTGECGDLGKDFICAEFDLTSKTDTVKGGKRNLSYRQTINSASSPDVRTALLTFSPTAEMRANNMTGTYNVINKTATITSDSTDCDVGFQNIGTDCKLINGVWKQESQLTKIITQPKNGGESCKTDSTIQYLDCERDKDCIVTLKDKDTGCINGSTQYRYTITQPSSGNGKTCSLAVFDALPVELKNPDLISINVGLNTATVDISCEDCVTDYVIDTTVNKGECAIIGGQYKITKIGKILKPAVRGGTCSVDKMSIVGKKKEESCQYNQNCEIDEVKISDECDDVTGIRTIKHKIMKTSLGNGKTCDDMGLLFSSEKYPESNSVKVENDMITINASCPVSKDCEIDWITKEISEDKVQGIAMETYKIVSDEVSRGKDCYKVTEEKYTNDKLLYSVKEDGKMYVYTEIEKENVIMKYAIYGVLALIMLVIIVFLIMK